MDRDLKIDLMIVATTLISIPLVIVEIMRGNYGFACFGAIGFIAVWGAELFVHIHLLGFPPVYKRLWRRWRDR